MIPSQNEPNRFFIVLFFREEKNRISKFLDLEGQPPGTAPADGIYYSLSAVVGCIHNSLLLDLSKSQDSYSDKSLQG